MGEHMVGVINLHDKFKKAAEYVIVSSARETTSCVMYTHPSNIPGEIMPPDEFTSHVVEIANIISSYKSVLDVDYDDEGIIDVAMGSDYCPLYETICGEDELDETRQIKNPLTE